MIRRLAIALLVLVAGLGAVGGWLAYYVWTPLDSSGQAREFEIERGASLRSVARDLRAAGILPDAWRFELLGRALKRESALKAGSYQFDARWSPLRLLDAITGTTAFRLDKVVLVEGWTFRQARSALDRHEALKHDSARLSDGEIVRHMGLAYDHAEGLFFPDTYYFAKGTSDLSVLRRAAARMQQILARQWEQRQDGLPLSDPYQALILASIVEKETGQEVDRPLVAAVLVNRLRKGMRLQVDPAVIYGLGEQFDGNLRRRDLELDGPYNTYVRAGLPPTPIAMPGLASLSAALQPASSPALYFVARGDGSSHFSDSLAEHNRAVTKYQRQGTTSDR
ncbi:MAG: endolytic transglycosylase MltG [Burkholderiales bacterium]|nr:endolytic transglycosylase MltG [Burkholderiales bacterium]